LSRRGFKGQGGHLNVKAAPPAADAIRESLSKSAGKGLPHSRCRALAWRCGRFLGVLDCAVIVSEICSQPGDIGDICFADLSQYALLIRNSARVETVIGPGFARDVQSWRLILRVTGQPMWNTAVTPYGGGQTLSWASYLGAR
jgi:hypothetical protein